MKTKTLSILLALVAILSMSVGVFAADFTETWDEETVLTVFSDLGLFFPDLFADEDSDYIWVESDLGVQDFSTESKDLTLADVEAKSPIESGTLTTTFDPCGDGLIKFELELNQVALTDSNAPYYGTKNTTFIRNITAKVGGIEASVKKAPETGVVKFNKDGKAVVKGYLYSPYVLTETDTPTVEMTITWSKSLSAFWKTDTYKLTVTDVAEKSKKSYCQGNFALYTPDAKNIPAVRGVYDENTGEARLQAIIRNTTMNPNDTKTNYVIPADVFVYNAYDSATGTYTKSARLTDYVCKYTVYNTSNAAPRTDYCKFGEGIAVAKNGLIRFDITVDHIPTSVLNIAKGDPINFQLRVGGMSTYINGVFNAVDFPCPIPSRLQVMNPLRPFMTNYELAPDSAIKASGAYGVYEGGLWGIYQKCGKYAYMAVRLKNDGLNEEVINLDHVAVAVNGGTPMAWNWVLSTVEADGNKITLESGDEVILIGRAYVTNVPSQLNADTAMTGAVNFTDYGFYITGKVYSDHNNTNCVAAPK